MKFVFFIKLVFETDPSPITCRGFKINSELRTLELNVDDDTTVIFNLDKIISFTISERGKKKEK